MNFKRSISALMSVLIVFSVIIPMPVLAAGNPAITISSVTDTPGSTVNVELKIKDNPGILGAELAITFDEGLTLIGASNGDAFSPLTMTKPGKLTSPCKFVWDGQELEDSDVKDGTILTLQFTLPENAEKGTKYNISAAYDDGAVVNRYLVPVFPDITNGYIEVLDYVYGDLNEDKKVNTTDVIMLRRHLAGGYEQTINIDAADVNTDTKKNTTDVILMRRFIAGGYGITFPYIIEGCDHVLQAFAAKEATYTEPGNIAYWQCRACNKYFADEAGEAEITLEETVLPVLTEDEYTITYHVYGNDEYLKSLNLENPNPTYYTKQDGLVLQDLIVNGYNFVGWFTSQTGGTQVTEISVGTTGNKVLYARWEKVDYTISFYSPIVEKEPITRTIDQETFIPDLQMHQYKFMGWTDSNGDIVTSVKPGTGNIKLYANWVSYRNQPISNDYKNDAPIIIEDEENQQYFFVYYIGKLINVPLYTIQDFGNTTSGIVRHESITKTSSISTTTANTITNSIVDSTTNSATWTLSKDWNTLVTNTEDFSETSLEESNILISDGYTHTDGSSTNTGTVTDTGTLTKDKTTTKDLTTTKHGNSAELGTEVSIGKDSWPVNVDISGSYEQHKDTTEEGGTVDEDGTDSYNLTHTNNLSSSSESTTNSHNKSVSETISNSTQKNWGFSIANSVGGEESSSEATESTLSNSNTYSTTLSYNTTETTTTVKEFSTEQAMPGWHRLVRAGTAHVFAVVGYDIPTRTYYNYSFSALDDEQYDFYDYSAHDGEYDDYETGVLPFEVPIDVHEYVTERVYRTNGLVVNAQTGTIVNYEGQNKYVNIPDYYNLDNGDGTYSAIKITGISSNAFNGNENVKGIRLSNYITEIPDNAFSGCTSLEYVTGPNIVKIGTGAFSGCISLEKYTVPTSIIELGENAFADVPEVNITAANVNVAKSASRTGANNLILDISCIPFDEAIDLALEVGNITSFELQGKDKEYRGLSLKSDAETTVINGVTFTENTNIPMELTSLNVILNRVTVDCSGYAMVLHSDDTNLLLNRTVNLMSTTGNAVVARGVNVGSLDSSVLGLLDVVGNVIICGELVDDCEAITVTDGEIIYVTEEEFENYLTPHTITFNANGGAVNTESKIVFYDTVIGELPEPSRDFYSFDGWYTEADGGDKITADTVMAYKTDLTLYAHWYQNDVSAWTLASEAPSDAEVVDRKYAYSQTQYTESTSTSLNGWERYDSYWSKSGSGSFNYANFSGYNMNGWYSDFKNDRWYNYENETSKRETSAVHSGYIYMHWCEGRTIPWGPTDAYMWRVPTYRGGKEYDTFHSFMSDENKSAASDGVSHWFSRTDICTDAGYWFKIPYYTCWYTDYNKIFKYRKTESKESSTYPSGSNISNIQEWVQYRAK